LKMSFILFFWNITNWQWIYLSRCQHPQRGLCSHCMPIAVRFNSLTPRLKSLSQYKSTIFECSFCMTDHFVIVFVSLGKLWITILGNLSVSNTYPPHRGFENIFISNLHFNSRKRRILSHKVNLMLVLLKVILNMLSRKDNTLLRSKEMYKHRKQEEQWLLTDRFLSTNHNTTTLQKKRNSHSKREKEVVCLIWSRKVISLCIRNIVMLITLSLNTKK
jgi:hypothetical protein